MPDITTEPEVLPIKVQAEVAGDEVKKWLNYKRIKPTTRQALGHNVSKLIEGVMYGDLVIESDFSITHKLNVPLTDPTGQTIYDKLKYKARLTGEEINACVRAGAMTDFELTAAYGGALTGMVSGMMLKLDSVDMSILAAVTVFFTQ